MNGHLGSVRTCMRLIRAQTYHHTLTITHHRGLQLGTHYSLGRVLFSEHDDKLLTHYCNNETQYNSEQISLIR
jgi:hypothetical protein